MLNVKYLILNIKYIIFSLKIKFKNQMLNI